MLKEFFKTFFVSVGILLGSFAQYSSVFAAGRSIAMSPMNQKVVLTPGETYRGGITLANPASSTEDLNYIVDISPYFPTKANENDNSYSGSDFSTKRNMNMIVDWITLDETKGTLAPNEECTVSFTITVPNDAPAGGQYAALLVREDKDAYKEEDSLSVTEVMQMGHIIYATVVGDTINKGSVVQNDFSSILLTNTLDATSLVRNDGNVHVDAKYILQVWPLGSDEELCTNEEDPSLSLVMPGTERYHVETCALPMIGIFRAKQTVEIFGEVSVLEKTVIVCPIWLLFLVVFAIVAIILWLVMRSKTRKKRAA